MRDTEILEELEAPEAARHTEALHAGLDPFAPRMAGATDLPAAGLPVWLQVERDLVARGWAVTARLLWVGEARRDHDSEQALGMTRNEAYARLAEVVRLDEGPRVP